MAPKDTSDRRKPSRVELAAELTELRGRVEVLESSAGRVPPAPVKVADLVSAVRELAEREDGSSDPGGAVVYAGIGPHGDGEIVRQTGRRLADVLAADRTRSGRLLAALGNPARLDIVTELLSGPLGRQELQGRLDRSTVGQLNHHLRELLAAELVEQPSRGVYQVPPEHVIPILTLLSCAADLTAGGAGLGEVQDV